MSFKTAVLFVLGFAACAKNNFALSETVFRATWHGLLNRINTETSIKFSDPTILIPIPRLDRDDTETGSFFDFGLGKNIFEGQMVKIFKTIQSNLFLPAASL